MLKIGLNSQRVLADFFQVSERTFKSNKEEYLKKLAEYCSYEITETGRIKINKVYEGKTYTPEPRSNKEKVKRQIPETVKRIRDQFNSIRMCEVAESIYNREDLFKKDGTKIKLKTVKNYVSTGVMEMFGKALNPGGPLGTRFTILLFLDEEKREMRLPTEEELTARNNIIQSMYGSKRTAKMFFKLQEGYVNGEYTKEDIEDFFKAQAEDRGSLYWSCRDKIEEKIGHFELRTVLVFYDENNQKVVEIE